MAIKRPLWQTRPIRFIGTLLSLLVATSGVSAQAYQAADPGIQGVVDAGLVTVIDETVDINGVQVTAQHAYADTQRIAARVKVSGDYEELLQTHMMNFALRDDTGRHFSYSAALPVTRDDDEQAEVYDVLFYDQTSLQAEDGSFEITDDYLDTLGEQVTLQLTVSFADMSALALVMEAAATEAVASAGVGPFDFQFSLPIHPAVTFMPEETRTAADVTMRLERVSVAPSETEVEVCYTLPDGQDWQPLISVTVGDVTAPASGANLVGMPSPNDTERCAEQRFSLYAGDGVDAITVQVERLQTSVPDAPDAWEGFVEELATFDIEAEAFPQPGAYFSIQSTPEGMTDAELAEVINNARENLRQTLDGPWTFEVGVP